MPQPFHRLPRGTEDRSTTVTNCPRGFNMRPQLPRRENTAPRSLHTPILAQHKST